MPRGMPGRRARGPRESELSEPGRSTRACGRKLKRFGSSPGWRSFFVVSSPGGCTRSPERADALRRGERSLAGEYAKGRSMKTTAEENKRLVLETFDALFNRRDYAAATKFWSPDYIQHSAHIEPGREGLFNLVKTLPSTLTYEAGTIVADEDFVIDHGRFSGFLPVNWIAADILRIEDGVLVEHWDVIQDEATEELSFAKTRSVGQAIAGSSAPGRISLR